MIWNTESQRGKNKIFFKVKREKIECRVMEIEISQKWSTKGKKIRNKTTIILLDSLISLNWKYWM